MKISFLHLSDLHLKSDDKFILNRAKKVVDAICSNGDFDELIICVTGDIAHSGQTNEYRIAGKFFGTMIKEFLLQKNYRPKIFVVPGNHDLDFEGKERDRQDIATILNNGVSTEIINEEIKKFNNFWTFSQYNGCFIDNKLSNTITLSFNEIKLRINLINSSLFSTYRDKLN